MYVSLKTHSALTELLLESIDIHVLVSYKQQLVCGTFYAQSLEMIKNYDVLSNVESVYWCPS